MNTILSCAIIATLLMATLILLRWGRLRCQGKCPPRCSPSWQFFSPPVSMSAW
ncbi:hypothetical protein [Marinobacterium aestuariivivens]|uniref:FeoB-associated Cys-rich membrane protein n=1 Tax=Marinobacterium aestuariivivens TaxID=1698799 RepID=A0ABW2A0E7_9GAMM